MFVHLASPGDSSSRMPNIYVSPFGTPLSWRDEESGVLPAAVSAYFAFMVGEGTEPTADQLDLLFDYVRYYINAPCWMDLAGGELVRLREQARGLASVGDIDKFIKSALEIGLDPF